ncbi:hypothetical protein TWF696_009902 [Orbilia brochopaga]|uniref:Uncharacterized protein n=1 Tax=Orbilia brochopaga TaxID=3140254 RepID=A0AAV9UDG2_9PEZI
MDDHGFGGTVGRKGGKKTKRGSSRKQIGDAHKEPPAAHDQESEAEIHEKSSFKGDSVQDSKADTDPPEQMFPSSDPVDSIPRISVGGPGAIESINDAVNESDKDKILRLEEELARVKTENAQLDDKYKGLLGRVASIRTTLTDRLNKDAEEYQQLKATAELLEERNKVVISEKEALEASLTQTLAEKKILSQEIQDLRQRFSVSQQNWSKEREEVDIIQNKLMEDLESTRKSAQDWEVLAMEESSVRRALEERCNDIEEQYLSQKDALEKEALLRSQQVAKVSDLEKALHDIQKTRKEELRSLVETTQSQIESLVSEKSLLQEKLLDAEAQVNRLRDDMQRMSNLEAEVKEKTLLIGKLRHQGFYICRHSWIFPSLMCWF